MIWFRFMVFNATFNNISVISWRSVLFIEETRKNHWSVTSHWQTLVVISTACIGSCKSSYHTITTALYKTWYIAIHFLHKRCRDTNYYNYCGVSSVLWALNSTSDALHTFKTQILFSGWSISFSIYWSKTQKNSESKVKHHSG